MERHHNSNAQNEYPNEILSSAVQPNNNVSWNYHKIDGASAPLYPQPNGAETPDRLKVLRKYFTLSNVVLGAKIIIIGGVAFAGYKVAHGMYTWYEAISSPIAALETTVSTEYHTLQTKYGYQWYDYFCPKCMLYKFATHSGNATTAASHHNHIMHALNGNGEQIHVIQIGNQIELTNTIAAMKFNVKLRSKNKVIVELVPLTAPSGDMATRNKTRHDQNNAIAILNQIASQGNDKRLPLYHSFIKTGSDDRPRFDVSMVFKNVTYVGLGGATKHAAKTKAASAALIALHTSPELNGDQRATLSAWTRDLTKDGDVESNPGPRGLDLDFSYPNEETPPDMSNFVPYTSYSTHTNLKPFNDVENYDRDSAFAEDYVADEYKAHLAKRVEYENATGNYFNYLSSLLNLPTSNRFALLCVDDVDPEPCDDETETSTPEKQKPRPPKVARERKERPFVEKPVPVKKIEKTEEEKKTDRMFALKRIAGQLKQTPEKVFLWVKRKMSPVFKTTILDLVFGLNWQEKTIMNQYEFAAYANLHDITDDELISTVINHDTKWASYSLQQKITLAKELNFSYVEAKSLSHNKEMHSANGNILSNTLSDVEEHDKAQNIVKYNQATLPQYRGIEAQVYITNVAGDTNPNFTRIFDQDRIRGNVVGAANNITNNCAVPLPMTCLIPRQVRPLVPGALVPALQRLRITELNTAEYYLNPIIATDLSKMISDQVKNNQSSNWRRDNNSLSGFSTFDIATINTALLPKGLTLESMLLKPDLLHSITSLRTNFTSINRSTFNAIDNNTVPSVGVSVTIGINNSPVFGEDCGGNNPVFPWLGNKGSVAFHLTLASVPIDQRDDAIVMPPGLLQASYDASEAVAMFVMSWAEWPFGIYTATRPTTDTAGGNNQNQVFVPTQSLTRVAGRRTLNIVLPKRFAEAAPTSGPQANAQATLRPTAGPVAAAGAPPILAGQVLDINFVGGALIAYPLTDYLYTWATQFDATPIRQYIGRLGVLMGVKDTLLVAHEMNIALCQQYPKMVTGAGGVASPAPNSIPQFDLCYCNHTQVTTSVANFPLAADVRADYRIFETNPATWNKVCLGLATAPNLTPDEPVDIPYHLGNPSNAFWERLESVPMAASWALYYNLRGLTTLAWNNAYTNANSVWAQRMARETFCTTHVTGTIVPARYGRIPHDIMKSVYGRAPKTTQTSKGGTLIDISHFERWLPGAPFASVYTAAGVEVTGLTPTILADIWIQYPADNLPILAATFPPPFHRDSVQGFDSRNGLAIHRNMNNDLVSPYMEPDPRAFFDVNKGPVMNDFAVWNSRLWFTHPNRQILDYSGGAIAEVIPAAGTYPLGRGIPLLTGENVPPELANASTICIPRFSNAGQRIFLYVTQAQSVQLVGACNRSNRLMRSAWLLNDVYKAPDVQQWGRDEEDEFDTITKSYFLDVTTAGVDNATNQIPATLVNTNEQAVDVSQLPSSANPSTTMEQPTSVAI
ncbi:coat protein [Artivirus sani]|uniref:Coat protein n=1 Tax=Armigeres subalbatus virus SaX06-AK20 TaxID=556524 RepID=D2CSN1_9VIRU|nr:coat protein [Armigeres subalbatus virus SaX06-AK20]ACH85915.1 coat protein [Armigeres subalbatus virus SaX06-AK20]